MQEPGIAHAVAAHSQKGPSASRITSFYIAKSASLHMASLLARPISRREGAGTSSPAPLLGYVNQWQAERAISVSHPFPALLHGCVIALQRSKAGSISRNQSSDVRLYRLQTCCPPETATCGILTALLQGQRTLGRKLSVQLQGDGGSCFQYSHRKGVKGKNSRDLASTAAVGFLRTAVLEETGLSFTATYSDLHAARAVDKHVATIDAPEVGLQGQVHYSPRWGSLSSLRVLYSLCLRECVEHLSLVC